MTAATNGRDAVYGISFVDSLTDKELAFLVMHENMHKCYRHLTTWRALYDIDRALSNQACDYVINIQLPALRERREDVPLLVQHFLEKYGEENERRNIEMSPEALDLLSDYDWPGNVRQLRNSVERMLK